MKTYLLLADFAELPIDIDDLPFDVQPIQIGIGRDKAVKATEELLDTLQESKELCRIMLFGTCGSLKHAPGTVLYDKNWAPDFKNHRIRTVHSLVTPDNQDLLKLVEQYDGYDMEMHFVMSAIKERGLRNVVDYYTVKVVSDSTVTSYADWKKRLSSIRKSLKWALFTYLSKGKENPKNAVKSYPNFPSPGVVFLDLFPSFWGGLSRFCYWFASAVPTGRAIVPIESRGFFMAGALLARELVAGVVPVRKENKLPGPVTSFDAFSEYGYRKLEVSKDHLAQLRPEGGELELLIVDDVLATGKTAKAVFDALDRKLVMPRFSRTKMIPIKVVGFCFYAEIENLEGRKELEKLAPVYSFIKF